MMKRKQLITRIVLFYASLGLQSLFSRKKRGAGGDNERMYPIEFEIKGQDKKIVYYHFDILI